MDEKKPEWTLGLKIKKNFSDKDDPTDFLNEFEDKIKKSAEFSKTLGIELRYEKNLEKNTFNAFIGKGDFESLAKLELFVRENFEVAKGINELFKALIETRKMQLMEKKV